MLRRQMQLDFSGIKTYSAEDRHNLVTIDNMMTPGGTRNSYMRALTSLLRE